ncbi:hypothetical protein [Spirosoma pomorum]
MTTVELNTQEQALQEQLRQIALDKENAAKQEYQDKLDAIAAHEDGANAYRNQAAKALTDDDKKRLYQYAETEEQLAAELRVQLGIITPEQLQDDVSERQHQQRQATWRQINGLFFKALLALVAFLISDYASAKLEEGFLSFALKSVAQIAYSLSGVFGGCWLVCIILFGYVSTYAVSDLVNDFRETKPAVRLAILTALFAAILHLLTGFIPDGV